MPDPTLPAPASVTTTQTVSSPPATTTTTATSLKPGWKTTEFWLTVLSLIVSVLLIADVFPIDSVWGRIIGAIGVVLSSLGYTIVRSGAKKAAAAVTIATVFFGSALFGGAVMSIGCNKATAKATLGAFVECGKQEIKSLTAELKPVMIDSLKNAIGGDGKIDRPKLSDIARPLQSAGTRCALDAAIAALLNPPKPAPGAPQSEAFPVDRADLSSAYHSVRDELWGGVQLKSAAAQ